MSNNSSSEGRNILLPYSGAIKCMFFMSSLQVLTCEWIWSGATEKLDQSSVLLPSVTWEAVPSEQSEVRLSQTPSSLWGEHLPTLTTLGDLFPTTRMPRDWPQPTTHTHTSWSHHSHTQHVRSPVTLVLLSVTVIREGRIFVAKLTCWGLLWDFYYWLCK